MSSAQRLFFPRKTRVEDFYLQNMPAEPTGSDNLINMAPVFGKIMEGTLPSGEVDVTSALFQGTSSTGYFRVQECFISIVGENESLGESWVKFYHSATAVKEIAPKLVNSSFSNVVVSELRGRAHSYFGDIEQQSRIESEASINMWVGWHKNVDRVGYLPPSEQAVARASHGTTTLYGVLVAIPDWDTVERIVRGESMLAVFEERFVRIVDVPPRLHSALQSTMAAQNVSDNSGHHTSYFRKFRNASMAARDRYGRNAALVVPSDHDNYQQVIGLASSAPMLTSIYIEYAFDYLLEEII